MSASEDVYVVGAGVHEFGRFDGVSGLDTAEVAIRRALVDANMSWDQIGYAVGGSNVSGKPDTLVGRLGLTGITFATVRNGCATGGVALATAANALRAGEADVALVVGFDKHPRGAFGSQPADYGLGEWYGESGMMVTTQYFAAKIRRYMHEHGVSEETLARVASKAFTNASSHPYAWRRKPLSVEEILDAPPVNPPLTQYMFCNPNEGAAALILARADRARDITDRPVRLASTVVRGRRFGSFEVFSPWVAPSDRTSPSIDAAAAAFARAGVTPADVDVAQVQDTESGAEVIHMAETGLCAHGEQDELLASGATAVGGRLPINTDGGCLGNGEPIGASGLRQVHEVFRQLQGRAPGLQVAGTPRVGFTHVHGTPGTSACAVLIA
jgi:acetyl-CoA acetyltransferase